MFDDEDGNQSPAQMQKAAVLEFIEVCIYCKRTVEENMQLLIDDNPDEEAEMREIARLAAVRISERNLPIRIGETQ